VVTIETTLWDMQPERVVWAVTSEAVDPKNVATLTGELAEVLITKMRQDGVL
jgi:hypothetical protein